MVAFAEAMVSIKVTQPAMTISIIQLFPIQYQDILMVATSDAEFGEINNRLKSILLKTTANSKLPVAEREEQRSTLCTLKAPVTINSGHRHHFVRRCEANTSMPLNF